MYNCEDCKSQSFLISLQKKYHHYQLLPAAEAFFRICKVKSLQSPVGQTEKFFFSKSNLGRHGVWFTGLTATSNCFIKANNLVSFFGRIGFFQDNFLVLILESVGELFPLTLVHVGVVEEPGEQHEVAAVHEERQLQVGVAHTALES